MKSFTFFLSTLCLITLISCGPDEQGPSTVDPCNPNFDQEAFFENIAHNMIIPGYEALETAVLNLDLATNDFLDQLKEEKLLALRAKYAIAYEQWQKVAQFEFGPAETVFLRNSVNNFPLNEEKVLENIQTGIYDFNMPDRYDKGFPALDFLLYGIADTDADIVNSYIIGANNDKFKSYLREVAKDIKERVIQVNAEWKNGYVNNFINNTGTAAGTSLSLVINGFNQNYELTKREKLGVPSGVLTLGIPNADRVEAVHSGLSTLLLKTSLEASINLYKGIGTDNEDGLGLEEYLDAADAKKSDALLSEIIQGQFTAAKNFIAQIEKPLDEEINSNPELVVDAYNEISKQLVNIKTDLPSVLCVSITYIDNPSDSD